MHPHPGQLRPAPAAKSSVVIPRERADSDSQPSEAEQSLERIDTHLGHSHSPERT